MLAGRWTVVRTSVVNAPQLTAPSQIVLGRRVRLQAKNRSAPPANRQAKHRIKEGRPQPGRAGRLVHQGLEGQAVKIIEQQPVTVVINQRPEIN